MPWPMRRMWVSSRMPSVNKARTCSTAADPLIHALVILPVGLRTSLAGPNNRLHG